MLYGCDFIWWQHHNGVPEFEGVKITQDKQARGKPQWHLHPVEIDKDGPARDRLKVKEFGKLGWGGNSGFQALNLAVQFGAKKIILVGYDMRLDRGLHWHGKHPKELNNPVEGNVRRWCRAIDGASVMLKMLGIKVVNTSKHSALENYPKMTFEEALEC